MRNGSKAATHRNNRLLAALEPDDFLWLEPHLEIVELPRGKVLYETGEAIRYTYFPHDAIVSLVTVLQDGGSVEMAIFGREAALGFVSALVTRQSFGRYITQIPGTASRVALERLNDAIVERPKMRHILFRFTEAFLAQTLQTVACNAVHSVEARFCRLVLSTRDRTDKDELPLTHEPWPRCWEFSAQLSAASRARFRSQVLLARDEGRSKLRIRLASKRQLANVIARSARASRS
jgi:CRP-like cAMP-binding protein